MGLTFDGELADSFYHNTRSALAGIVRQQMSGQDSRKSRLASKSRN